MSDLRIQINFTDHPKTIKLVRFLGEEALRMLLRLWGACAQNCPDGGLRGMDAEDIEIMAGWDGESGLFVKTLVQHGWLDLKRNTYHLHNWKERQPWICNSRLRSQVAKKKAEKRWKKRLGVEDTDNADEKGMQALKFSNADCNAVSKNQQCSSPVPVPSPVPSPNPSPSPTPTYMKKAIASDYTPEFLEDWNAFRNHDAHEIGSGPGSKAMAFKAYVKQGLQEVPREDLQAGIRNYLDDAEGTKCKTLHMSTFLNRGIWDEWKDRRPRNGTGANSARRLLEEAAELERQGL